MIVSSTTRRLLTLCALGAWLLNASGTVQAADPTLSVARDPTGAKITWDATDGRDYVLEASNDFQTWVQVNQSVVKEGTLHRVFVPATAAKNFYRLVNDGQRRQAAYVGTAACKTCHPTVSGQFNDSGHGYKLVKVNGAPPKYFSAQQVNVPNTPAGWTWNDVSWVIGGAWYKARFVDQNGYVVTGPNVQYNNATQGWVGYETSVPLGTKPYDCGACHTTGWVPVSQGGVRHDGLPGMAGSFAEPGVQCEACHGPGGRHVVSLSKNDIKRDTSSALCGSCHVRGAKETIPASGGFIRHHESYNEFLSSKHAGLSCVSCHNPHVSARRGLPNAMVKDCTDCHSPTRYANDPHSAFTDCTTCHMPYATRTAVSVNKYVGDIRTHIFKINTAADGQMFTPDGAFANGNTGVTLGYVCYQCHKDADGVGGSEGKLTLQQLSNRARGFHN
ncbi:MAG: hypothetical protein FJ387_00910 [Verrucomicrobia bacterium]|nr:hypothetical protein [Verrucomicrobiota bacterium]